MQLTALQHFRQYYLLGKIITIISFPQNMFYIYYLP